MLKTKASVNLSALCFPLIDLLCSIGGGGVHFKTFLARTPKIRRRIRNGPKKLKSNLNLQNKHFQTQIHSDLNKHYLSTQIYNSEELDTVRLLSWASSWRTASNWMTWRWERNDWRKIGFSYEKKKSKWKDRKNIDDDD